MPIDEKIMCVMEKYSCDPGERYRPVYTSEIKDDGTIELVQTGVEDLQEIYNSMRDSCDVNLIAERFLAGDDTALKRGNPVFLDLLGAPDTLMEAYQLQHRAEQAFNLLPVSIREKFNQSFPEFIASVGTPAWYAALKMDDPNNITIEKESGTSEP